MYFMSLFYVVIKGDGVFYYMLFHDVVGQCFIGEKCYLFKKVEGNGADRLGQFSEHLFALM